MFRKQAKPRVIYLIGPAGHPNYGDELITAISRGFNFFRSRICGGLVSPPPPDQRWISTRFHPHLLAAAVGAWGVAIPVSKDYYRTKHESLVELGSGWALADDLTDPVPPPSSTVNPFGGRLSAMSAAKRRVADQVTALIKAGRA